MFYKSKLRLLAWCNILKSCILGGISNHTSCGDISTLERILGIFFGLVNLDEVVFLIGLLISDLDDWIGIFCCRWNGYLFF